MKLSINLVEWIESNREQLKPPICNKILWEDEQFFVMVVGSPNERQDFHINTSEEFFYQLEGQLILQMRVGDKREVVTVNAGEVYLLSANIPHRPLRPAGGIGLVIEHHRQPSQLDGFQWYCENCDHLLHEEWVAIHDIEKQLPLIKKRFFTNLAYRTCNQCGEQLEQKCYPVYKN